MLLIQLASVETPETRLMRCELSYLREPAGTGQSRAVAERLLRTAALGSKQRSICELAIGNIELDEGNVQAALAHFQRALSSAEAAEDRRRVSWCQLRMIPLVAEMAGPHAAVSLLAQARSTTTRLEIRFYPRHYTSRCQSSRQSAAYCWMPRDTYVLVRLFLRRVRTSGLKQLLKTYGPRWLSCLLTTKRGSNAGNALFS